MEFDEKNGMLNLTQIDRFRLHTRQDTISVSDSERLEEVRIICEEHLGKLGARSYVDLNHEEYVRRQREDLASAEWAVGIQNVIDMALMMQGATESYGFRR